MRNMSRGREAACEVASDSDMYGFEGGLSLAKLQVWYLT